MFRQRLQPSTELAGLVYSVNCRKGCSVLMSSFFPCHVTDEQAYRVVRSFKVQRCSVLKAACVVCLGQVQIHMY